MKLSDKVALILSKYGFGLAEGMEIYVQLVKSKTGDLFIADLDKNCVLLLNTVHDDDNNWLVTMRVWREYCADFCLNYRLAGAIAMHDPDLKRDKEETAKLLEFFQLCHEAYREDGEIYELSPDLKGIFTCDAIKEYMDRDDYEVSESTQVTVYVNE